MEARIYKNSTFSGFERKSSESSKLGLWKFSIPMTFGLKKFQIRDNLKSVFMEVGQMGQLTPPELYFKPPTKHVENAHKMY